jgi:glycosyltransferase involved in cell wall biosynthesis
MDKIRDAAPALYRMRPESGMRVLLLARYAHLGPSSRIRCFQYVDYLRAHAVEVTSAPFLDNNYVKSFVSHGTRPPKHVAAAFFKRVRWLLRARQYDLLWMQYEALPWLPDIVERVLTPSRVPYVVDYDDAQFHRYDEHPTALVRRMLGSKLDRVMSRAAVVVAGNQYLADRARAAKATDIELLPSAVDLSRYPLRPALAVERPFTIGWIGSPISTHYLALVAEALREVCLAISARVVLIGAGSIDLPGVPVERLEWNERTEANHLEGFDVGIMPLTDGPTERGKCGFKLVQYMASARPVVASAVGANPEIVRHGETGFLVSSAEDWVRALLALAVAPDLRRRMGAAGRAVVEREYSTAVVRERLLEVFRRAAGSAVS